MVCGSPGAERRGRDLALRPWAEYEVRVGEHAHRYTQFFQRYRAWKLRQKRSMRQSELIHSRLAEHFENGGCLPGTGGIAGCGCHRIRLSHDLFCGPKARRGIHALIGK